MTMKIFVSIPMHGRTDEEVRKEISTLCFTSLLTSSLTDMEAGCIYVYDK